MDGHSNKTVAPPFDNMTQARSVAGTTAFQGNSFRRPQSMMFVAHTLGTRFRPQKCKPLLLVVPGASSSVLAPSLFLVALATSLQSSKFSNIGAMQICHQSPNMSSPKANLPSRILFISKLVRSHHIPHYIELQTYMFTLFYASVFTQREGFER